MRIAGPTEKQDDAVSLWNTGSYLQRDIGSRLGITQSAVSYLLKRAKKNGIDVKIFPRSCGGPRQVCTSELEAA